MGLMMSISLAISLGLSVGDFQEVIALLSLLDEDVLVVEQHLLRGGGVGVGHLLLVDSEAATLGELAQLPFGGEDRGMVDQQVGELGLILEQLAGNLKLGHAVEDRQQRGLVDFVEGVGGLVAEKNLRRLDGHLVILGGVNHSGDFLGQTLLQGAQAGVGLLLLDERVDFLLVEDGEYLDVFRSVVVAYVEPELVELVGGGALGVEPDVAALGLAELAAVGLGDQRACEGESVVTSGDAAYQLCAGGDVAPLVRAAKLQVAALVLVEVEEVIALEELV